MFGDILTASRNVLTVGTVSRFPGVSIPSNLNSVDTAIAGESRWGEQLAPRSLFPIRRRGVMSAPGVMPAAPCPGASPSPVSPSCVVDDDAR